NSVDQRPVRLDRIHQLFDSLTPQDTDKREERDREELEMPAQRLVSRAAPDVTVELEVGLRGFVVPVGFDSIVERGEASLQLREFRFAHSPGGFERGLDLQDRAQVYALADLLHGE